MKNILKLWDYIIIGIVLMLIILSFAIIQFIKEGGHTCTIRVGEKEVYRLSLNDNREISIQGPIGETYIQIENGFVWITEAPCRQKTCQRMGKISQNGEIIVCIPNKVIIQVVSGYKRNIDGITL